VVLLEHATRALITSEALDKVTISLASVYSFWIFQITTNCIRCNLCRFLKYVIYVC